MSGLLYAAQVGFAGAYVRSYGFALGAAGVAWVFVSIRYRIYEADALYRHARNAFSSPGYDVTIRTGVMSVCSWRAHATCSAVLFAMFFSAALLGLYGYPVHIFGVSQESLRPVVFSPQLYTPVLRPHTLVLVSVFAAAIATALGTSVWMIFRNLILLREASRLATVPLPEAVRSKMRRIAYFHARVALDWLGGAVLFFLLFFRTADYISLGLMFLLLFVGIVVFLYPQVVLGRAIRRSHSRICDVAIDAWHAQRLVAAPRAGDADELVALADLRGMVQDASLWIYDTGESVRWSIALIAAIIALIVQYRGV